MTTMRQKNRRHGLADSPAQRAERATWRLLAPVFAAVCRRAYVLDGKRPRPARHLREWMAMLESNRQVALTVIGCCRVSTVFLGHDHTEGRAPEPQLFETALFCDGRMTGPLLRAASWNAALANHGFTKALLRARMARDAGAEAA